MRVLFTGAGGAIGSRLAQGLHELGYRMRLSGRRRPDNLPGWAEWAAAELGDRDAVFAACQGVDAIVHMGAISKENDFEAILDSNIRGTYHIYEGARLAGARRVIFASSNHAIGFYPVSQPIDATVMQRPDSFYGLSKAYGEMLGGLYWERHGIESASLRIGSFEERPANKRHLSTWISHRDMLQMIDRCLTAPKLGAAIYYGVSDNDRCWWSDSAAAEIGYRPQDNAEVYAGEPGMLDPLTPPVAEHYQGGVFCAHNRTRPFPDGES